MEGSKDLVPLPTNLDTVKGQKGNIQKPEVTFHTTVNHEPVNYNQTPQATEYTNKGTRIVTENKGSIIDVKTKDPTIK